MASKQQWWVVWDVNNNNKITVVQASSAPATPSGGKVFGPYATKADAEQEANPNSSLGTVIGLGIGAGAGKATGGAVGDTQSGPSDPLAAIGDFFNKLGEANTWIRVAEVLLGLALIGIGIAHITGADNVISKAARTAVKAGALA